MADLSNQSNCSESYSDYLNRAAAACEAGDLVLGMHLYLAAYERAVVDPDIPDGMAIAGLREAWNLACDLKERSMAEYVFEKLEPFLTGEEIAQHANKLQDLALDRLEEYGFSREELQDMAEMISQDLIDGEGSIVKVESISLPHVGARSMAEALAELGQPGAQDVHDGHDGAEGPEADVRPEPESAPVPPTPKGRPAHVDMGNADPEFNPYDQYNTSSVGMSYHAATNDGSGSYIFTRDEARAAESEAARAKSAQPGEAGGNADASEPESEPGLKPASAASNGKAPAGSKLPAPPEPAAAMPSMPEVDSEGSKAPNYRTLVGYDETVSLMRDMGIGLQREPGFRNFIEMLNARHGIDCMPALDTLLFRAPVIEDASRFIDATAGEIGLPVLRMSMEEGFQGAPVLCVSVRGDSRPRMNHAQNRFAGPGILIVEDLDMWVMPQLPEGVEGLAGFVMANMSRGAREALSLIRSAVEDPDVFVLATATTQGEVDPFFYELLEPISIIDIELPTEHERDEVWAEIMRDHPSMRGLDRALLARLSAGLPRNDLYMAARAAVEEAYKTGLVERMYVPVTPQNIFDKLAAWQPLDSEEYRAIEDEVVRGFRDDLENLEDLMDGSVE